RQKQALSGESHQSDQGLIGEEGDPDIEEKKEADYYRRYGSGRPRSEEGTEQACHLPPSFTRDVAWTAELQALMRVILSMTRPSVLSVKCTGTGLHPPVLPTVSRGMRVLQ